MRTMEDIIQSLRDWGNKRIMPFSRAEFLRLVEQIEFAWVRFGFTDCAHLRAENARLRVELERTQAELAQWRKQALEEDALNNVRGVK